MSSGAQMDFDSLLRPTIDCLGVLATIEDTLSEENCPMVFDSWSCWNESKRGTIQEQPCPNFPHLGFSPNSESILHHHSNLHKRVKGKVLDTLLEEGVEYPLGRDLAHVLSNCRPFKPRAPYPNTDGWRLFLKFR